MDITSDTSYFHDGSFIEVDARDNHINLSEELFGTDHASQYTPEALEKEPKIVKGRPHWHRYNPNSKMGKKDEYLNAKNSPVAKDSPESHLYPPNPEQK